MEAWQRVKAWRLSREEGAAGGQGPGANVFYMNSLSPVNSAESEWYADHAAPPRRPGRDSPVDSHPRDASDL